MDWIKQYSEILKLYPGILKLTMQYLNGNDDQSCKIIHNAYSKECLVWKWNDIFIAADYPDRHNIDSIFPPHPESFFLAQLIPETFGTNNFLDVGIGSGVLSIVAAKKGWNVLGVDINERAINVSNNNAILNNVKINTSIDYLAKSQQGNNIQLCIANLPFESTPIGINNYSHSDGGKYGDDLIFEFFEVLPGILTSGGSVIIPSFSLMNGSKSRLEEKIRSIKKSDLNSMIFRLSKPIEIKYLYARYPFHQCCDTLKILNEEGYFNFTIDFAILKKIDDKNQGKFLGVFEATIADKMWILPKKWDGIGQPLDK